MNVLNALNAFVQGYRTYIVAAIIGILGALAELDWANVLANPKDGLALIVTAVLMALMRTITKGPPGKAAPTA